MSAAIGNKFAARVFSSANATKISKRVVPPQVAAIKASPFRMNFFNSEPAPVAFCAA
jgi:hypothetical protein